MTHIKKTILSILILASLFVWRTETVQAINCAPVDAERLQSGLEEFEAVFIGEVVATDRPGPHAVPTGTAHYRVDRVFKGVVPENVSMETSMWGDPFTGFTYLMFIDSLGNPSFDSPAFAADCRNTIIDQIDFDYAALLGEGYEPIPGDNTSIEENSLWDFTKIPTFAIVSAIIALGLIGTALGMRFMHTKRLLITITLLLMVTLAACQMPPPIIDTTEPLEIPTESPNAPAPPDAEEMPEVLGCADGGPGVFTPEDLRCYLDAFEEHLVHELNDEVTLLVLPADSHVDWIGGASLYHIPTVSSVTLDVNGYVDPTYISINTWPAWHALLDVLDENVLMEEVRKLVVAEWQRPEPDAVTLKLGAAYQEGNDIVFLWSLVGLAADDDTYYCKVDDWWIGFSRFNLGEPACAMFEPPVGRIGQMEYEITGHNPMAQVCIWDLCSNEIQIAKQKLNYPGSVSDYNIVYLVGQDLIPSGFMDVDILESTLGATVVDDIRVLFDLEQIQPIDALIIYGPVIEAIPRDWITERYNQGMVIAGFNVYGDQLDELVDDPFQRMDKFTPDPYMAPFFLIVSRTPVGGNGSGRGGSTDTLDSLTQYDIFKWQLLKHLNNTVSKENK